jgi:alpha-tubulin suppressor-like RCC1 family protein
MKEYSIVYTTIKTIQYIPNKDNTKLIDDLYVWGYNKDGELGLGDTDNRFAPILNSYDKLKWKYIDSNGFDYSFTIGLASNSDLYSWGNNYYGQLGLGNTISYNIPKKITYQDKKWKAI